MSVRLTRQQKAALRQGRNLEGVRSAGIKFVKQGNWTIRFVNGKVDTAKNVYTGKVFKITQEEYDCPCCFDGSCCLGKTRVEKFGDVCDRCNF